MITRAQFIRQLAAATGASALLPISEAAGAPLLEETVLFDGFIAGYQYWEGHRRQLRLQPDDALQLRREPLNKHDKYAIAVYLEEIKLGYLPRYENRVLAKLLDAGYELTARVKGHRPEFEEIGEGVWMEVGIKPLETKKPRR